MILTRWAGMQHPGDPKAAWLESSSGERTLVHGSCFIGRSVNSQIVLSDTKASRQHALVHSQEQGEFWLVDLGSANGTYLNGRRVSQPCRLNANDKILIAGVTFTFHSPGGSLSIEPDLASNAATIHELRTITCWLLVADIQGSTQLLRKLPMEEAHRITGRWLAASRKCLTEHHGTINKFLGDGFLAYWNGGGECASSVVGALKILRKMQDESNPCFRMVLHHGKVSAGGYPGTGEETLTGNEVNFVFRAEKLAGSLGEPRLMSEPAQQGIQRLLPSTPMGRHTLQGFQDDYAFFSF